MTRRLLILGAGGHGRVVAALLAALPEWSLAGFVDAAPAAARAQGMPVLGDEAALPALLTAGIAHAIVAIGDNEARLAAGDRLVAGGFTLPPLVHPSVISASDATVGAGAVVFPRAVLGAGCRVGRLVIVNTGAIVEHDVILEDGAHVASGAVLAGGVRVGAAALVGVGAACRPGVTIGAGAVVGVGAGVTADVPPRAVVGGVPARLLRSGSG
jgi:UDP-perosamine 4-acetyltransferase